jgi:hypothetical protein
MGNVFDFPKGDGNDWPSVRDSLLDVLDEKWKLGLSDRCKDHVLERMASVYKELPFPKEIDVYAHEGDPAVIQETIETFLNDFQEHISSLMINRLLVEVELALAKKIF